MLLSGAAPHLSTTAGGGPSSSSAAPSGDEASTPNPKSISLEMWRAFARMDEDASRAAIRKLEQLQGGSMFSFEVVSSEGSSSTTQGAYSPTVTLPPGTPKSTVNCWNITKPTSLMRINPDAHCLALDGNPDNEPPNTKDFIACGQHLAGVGLSSDCAVGTHTKDKRKKRPVLQPDGPAYVVKVWTASSATKIKVHSNPILLERDLPLGLIDTEFVRNLEDWKTPASVWRHLLTYYPGLDVMTKWMEDIGLHRPDDVDVEFSTPRASSPHPTESDDRVEVETVYSGEGEVNPQPSELDKMMEGVFRATSKDAVSIASTPRSVSSSRNAQPEAEYPWEREFNNQSKSLQPAVVQSMPTSSSTNNNTQGIDDLAREIAMMKSELAEFKKSTSASVISRDKSIAAGFKNVHQYIDTIVDDLKHNINRIQRPSLSSDTKMSWSDFTDGAKNDLAYRILEAMDMSDYAKQTGQYWDVDGIKQSVNDARLATSGIEARIAAMEREFSSSDGSISELRATLADWEKRRDSSSSTRGGYTFRDEADVEALTSLVPDPEFYRYFLDIFSYLSLCTEAFSTYEQGITVHANAIKAAFKGVWTSRVRLSYEVPYPEVMIKTIEAADTVSGGGTKWGPMFHSAEAFEDQFRVGAHRRVTQGIENVYELTSAAVDKAFPLSGDSHRPGTDTRKINMIIQEHNRLGYQQTIALIDSFLPMYKTFKNGGLPSKDAWERVHVFAREFLAMFQKERVASADLGRPSALIWGTLKATDLGEEFRKAKFIEHPKVLSILALTSLEREGKSIAQAMASIQSEKDSIKALTGRIAKAETTIKALQAKVQ